MQFEATFEVDYCFQETQIFKVDVYDADDRKHIKDFSKQDYIGFAKFKLADVVTANEMLSKPLRGSYHVNVIATKLNS